MPLAVLLFPRNMPSVEYCTVTVPLFWVKVPVPELPMMKYVLPLPSTFTEAVPPTTKLPTSPAL